MRAIPRPGPDHAQATAYGAMLGGIFDDWVRVSATRGASVQGLSARLQQAAAASFTQAFLSGKRQAFPGSGLTGSDRTWIAERLQRNEHYLTTSLGPDVQGKMIRQQLQPSDPDFASTIRTAFGARVRNGYGGALWTVTEAGFRAGIRDLKQALTLRVQQGLLHEEGDDGEGDESIPGDRELALALGLSLAAFLLLVDGSQRAGVEDRTPPPIIPGQGPGAMTWGQMPSVGVQYNAEDDDATCAGCAANAGTYENEDDCPLPGEAECQGNCRCWLTAVELDDADLAEAA